MSAARLKFTAILLVAALIAVGAAFWQFVAARVARDELAVQRWRMEELEASRASLQDQLAAARQRAAAAARDRSSVRTVVKESVARVEARASAANEPPVTAELVQTRYQHARELAKNGQHEEALREFLWCFDVGMPRAGLSSARLFSLILEIGELGKQYPEALAALRVRRDQVEARVLASESDSEAVTELANLNRTLGESDRNIELYDRFPAGDRRRRMLANGAFESLVDSRRYDAALEGRPYGSMSSAFEVTARSVRESRRCRMPRPSGRRRGRASSKARRETSKCWLAPVTSRMRGR